VEVLRHVNEELSPRCEACDEIATHEEWTSTKNLFWCDAHVAAVQSRAVANRYAPGEILAPVREALEAAEGDLAQCGAVDRFGYRCALPRDHEAGHARSKDDDAVNAAARTDERNKVRREIAAWLRARIPAVSHSQAAAWLLEEIAGCVARGEYQTASTKTSNQEEG
jgi:hypothetical protein